MSFCKLKLLGELSRQLQKWVKLAIFKMVNKNIVNRVGVYDPYQVPGNLAKLANWLESYSN